MLTSVYKCSVFFIIFIIFLISERRAMESAALKCASELGSLIGDTWKCKLHNEYASIELVIAIAKCQRAKMLPVRARC